MDRSSNFQIHCVAYRMPNSASHLPQIPRYYITVGKGETQEIIWDFPQGQDIQTWLGNDIKSISTLLAEYCQTPRDELKTKNFDDPFGITSVLKRFDRRLSKE